MISSIHSEPQSSNPEDNDLITLQATVVTHHQNKNTPLLPATSLPILVPSSYIPYKLSPTLIQGKITCHHAQDVSFYKREFHHTPLFTVWIICREIKPLYSQKRFFEHAWQRNIQVRLMEMSKFECLVATNSCSNSDREVDTASSLLYDGEICKEWPQVIIPRMGSKITYFGLALIRFFEGLKENKPFILNESKGIEIAKDKFITMQKLASQHISIPKTMLLIHPLNIEQVHQHFEYPLVLKKVSGSQGKGVMLIHDRSQLVDLAEMVDPNSQMLLQEFIRSSKGVDIRVLVLGEKVLGAIKRIAKEGFKANFHQGGNVEPFALTPCIENLAVSAVKACGLLFAGVDILMGESSDDSYRVCEVNSSPGFEGFELATGIDVAREVMSFCETNVFH